MLAFVWERSVMAGPGWVALAALAFVGTHFLLSPPLSRPLVAAFGESTFLVVYSLVAGSTIAGVAWSYQAAPTTTPLLSVGSTLWAIVTVVMLLASVLLMGSVIRNPALPTGGAPAIVPDRARGVFTTMRHPMIWAFALWGLGHVAVYPVAKNIVVALAIVILALVGAALQDHARRKAFSRRSGVPGKQRRATCRSPPSHGADAKCMACRLCPPDPRELLRRSQLRFPDPLS